MEDHEIVTDPTAITDRASAARAIAALGVHQTTLMDQGREHDAKFAALDRKVQDVLDAQRVLTERETLSADVPVAGVDRDLSQFVREDGSVQWRAASETVQIPGGESVQVRASGLLDSGVARGEWHRDLVRIVSGRNLARAAMANPRTPHMDAELIRHLQRAPRPIRDALSRAFDGQTAQGAEWLRDDFVPDLYIAYQTPRGLRAMFQPVGVNSDTIIVPRLTRGARPYLKGQIRSDDPGKYTPSTPTSAKATIEIVGMAVRVLVDDATLEDSAVVAGPALRSELVGALDDGWEDCAINGDSAATHQDAISSWNIRDRWGASGLGGTADHRRGWLGFRAAAVDKSLTLDLSGTMSSANFAAQMALHSERSVGRLVNVTSPEAFVQDFLTMSDVKTVDKFGASATILSGALAALFNVPILISRFMSADLNASGLYDGVTTTKTGNLMIDRDAWYRYVRRAGTVETDKEIASGAVEMVATVRETMGTPDASDAPNVSYGYNL